MKKIECPVYSARGGLADEPKHAQLLIERDHDDLSGAQHQHRVQRQMRRNRGARTARTLFALALSPPSEKPGVGARAGAAGERRSVVVGALPTGELDVNAMPAGREVDLAEDVQRPIVPQPRAPFQCLREPPAVRVDAQPVRRKLSLAIDAL